ncbi:MAG: hypothetical protein OXB93_01605 [Cytophagales bacterium]|nr:hypothetical protein [Cytophagales bacterium]
MRSFSNLFLCVLGGLFLSSCIREVDCQDSYLDHFVAGFYVSQSGEVPLLRTVSFTQIWASPELYEEPLYTSIDLLRTFRLPVHPEANKITYRFCKKDDCQEIRFSYRSDYVFLSKDCGSRWRVELEKVLSHDFDSVKIVQHALTRTVPVHVQIFQ